MFCRWGFFFIFLVPQFLYFFQGLYFNGLEMRLYYHVSQTARSIAIVPPQGRISVLEEVHLYWGDMQLTEPWNSAECNGVFRLNRITFNLSRNHQGWELMMDPCCVFIQQSTDEIQGMCCLAGEWEKHGLGGNWQLVVIVELPLLIPGLSRSSVNNNGNGSFWFLVLKILFSVLRSSIVWTKSPSANVRLLSPGNYHYSNVLHLTIRR